MIVLAVISVNSMPGATAFTAIPLAATARAGEPVNATLSPCLASCGAWLAVRPRPAACAVADSPAGLVAWLWWRRQLWCDGDALEVFGLDDLCTLSSIYWFNTSIASSLRLYFEQFGRPPRLAHDRVPVIEAPTGYGVFPKELLFIPRQLAESHTNLHRWSVFDRGGHFAPRECPDEVTSELRAFFTDLR